MNMVLCLFVYAMTEFRFRRELQETGETVTGQTKKQTQNPTLKWMFFRGVRELRFRAGETVKVLVMNMMQDLWKIPGCSGRSMKNITSEKRPAECEHHPPRGENYAAT